MYRKSILLVAAIFSLIFASIGFPLPGIAVENNVVNLDQGWTKSTQQKFYFADQGSQLMPYDWFLALEQDANQELFRSEANIQKLRYLTAVPSKLNPDGLPVGFAKGRDRKGQEWLGFNCALCHTGQISYGGKEIRLDGGATIGDVQGLQYSLVKALDATYNDPDKFQRFTAKVLGTQANSEQVKELHQQLGDRVTQLANYNKINYEYTHQPDYGFGRVDAIGSIFNQVMVTFNDLPVDKALPSDAPVSYPFIWGTNESDVVQWAGFAPNGPASFGTLIRNAGEVLGTFGTVEIDSPKSLRKFEREVLPFPPYESSINTVNLGKIENWVAQLRSPQWPEQYLPAVDHPSAQKGKAIYETNCASCHQLVPHNQEGLPYKAVLTPIKDVNTDSTQLDNLVLSRDAGKYQGRFGLIPKLEKIPAETNGTNPLFNAVLGSLIEHPINTLAAANIEFVGTLVESIKTANKLPGLPTKYLSVISQAIQASSLDNAKKGAVGDVYKARPLNGIWATAPYLHNGSVPNLYELLLTPEERSQKFYVGNREFDPQQVGYVSTESTSEDLALFEFDTALKGNSNQGHAYGTDLPEAEKWQLVEFLKTL